MSKGKREPFGGWNPHEITCIESGISFEFMNANQSGAFLNIEPKYISKKIDESGFSIFHKVKVRKNNKWMFYIKRI